ncbi:MAG: CbiX/SirB N-terminal domain-containing protein [Pirellulales bacterium]
MILAQQFSDQLQVFSDRLGLIIVDHGSVREESNRMLLEVVRRFAEWSGLPIVEPAHMELAEPSIAAAFDRCVERGAKLIAVFPYFLLPGRHWQSDIPRLVADAARKHADIKHLVTAPLALHPLMLSIIGDRLTYCLAHAQHGGPRCDACHDLPGCQLSENPL